MIEINIAIDNKTINDFLDLPNTLYEPSFNTQDYELEYQLLNNTHVLSHYFDFKGFVAYNNNQPCARCALTIYKDDDKAYFGFFESINDQEVVNKLFDEIKMICLNNNIKEIVGPLNASFWLGYRLRTSNFTSKPFSSEPYNLAYYPKLITTYGFDVNHNYVSNFYQENIDLDNYKKANDRLQYVIDKYECQVITPKRSQWSYYLPQIYDLLCELFNTFPEFKLISFEEFLTLFDKLKYVLNFKLIKLVYNQHDDLVAFAIPIPDYGTLVNQELTVKNIINILKIKKHPKSYILMYLGVKPEFSGLGLALSLLVSKEIYANNARGIGALIHEGKATQMYGTDYVEQTTCYQLYNLKI